MVIAIKVILPFRILSIFSNEKNSAASNVLNYRQCTVTLLGDAES